MFGRLFLNLLRRKESEMAADMFSKFDAINFFSNKHLCMFGDSNVRAIYKDITWLLEEGNLIPIENLRAKNERSHAGDRRLSNGQLTASRNYVEVREYTKGCSIRFEFITRLYSARFRKIVLKLKTRPDFIIVNSCLWDLSRWGPKGIREYKLNVQKTMEFLRRYCPRSRIIFTTTLPPSFKARGGFLTENIKFLTDTLPFNVLEANHYTAALSKKYEIDIIDLHYYLRFSIDHRRPDGIHWEPAAVRYITNIILTHLSATTLSKLPGNISLLYKYNINSYNDQNNNRYSTRPSTSNNNCLVNASNILIRTANVSVNISNFKEDVHKKRKRTVTYTNRYNPYLHKDNYYQQLYDFNTR